MKNFRKLLIWQKGMEIVKMTYELAGELPNGEKYGLKSQICRAAVSIPSNIAEGSSRNSDKDFKRFLEIALGSAFEMETQLLVVKEMRLAQENSVDNILNVLTEEQKMINGYIQKLALAIRG